MSQEEDKEKATKAKSSKRGPWKALRVARRKAYYAARPGFTLDNKKRTLARHIRYFPEDEQAKEIYKKQYREASLISVLAEIVNKAKRREAIRNGSAKRVKKVKSVKKVQENRV